MRLKFDNADPRSFRCCFCCHVKTGTVLIGLWNLLMQLFLIGLLVLMSFHPDILQPKQPQITSEGIIITETHEGTGFQTYPAFVKKPLTKEDLSVGYALTLAYISITIALIWGVIGKRPGFLMPFFCLQVFDFCLNCLTMVGYFSYAPNIKMWIRDQGMTKIPGMEHILDMNTDVLMLLFLTLFVVILIIKAYLLGVVWACYKYLQLKVANRDVIVQYSIDPDSEQILLPPKYEDAIKLPIDSNMPPPYASVN